YVAARNGSAVTAAKAPVTAVAVQPVPVTRGMRGTPLCTRATGEAETMTSMGPLTDTTHPCVTARAHAASNESSAPCTLSTPRVAPVCAPRARIADTLLR